MKRIVLVLAILSSSLANAQFEVGTSLIDPILNRATLTVSYNFDNSMAVSLKSGFLYGYKPHVTFLRDFRPTQQGAFFQLRGRYYLQSLQNTGYYAGLFVHKTDFQYRDKRDVSTGEFDFYKKSLATGIFFGKKQSIAPQLMLDYSLGVGAFLDYELKRYSEQVDPANEYTALIIFDVGLHYRF